MSNRIVLPNGEPSPEKKVNMKDLLITARHSWSIGKKGEAFEAVCSALELLSGGVGKVMRDVDAIKEKGGK